MADQLMNLNGRKGRRPDSHPTLAVRVGFM